MDGEIKKLNEQKFKAGDIEINKYMVSLITSSHDRVDVTKNGKTELILKISNDAIDTIMVVRDTILIKASMNASIIYKKQDVFGYKVVIDQLPTRH